MNSRSRVIVKVTAHFLGHCFIGLVNVLQLSPQRQAADGRGGAVLRTQCCRAPVGERARGAGSMLALEKKLSFLFV